MCKSSMEHSRQRQWQVQRPCETMCGYSANSKKAWHRGKKETGPESGWTCRLAEFRFITEHWGATGASS